MMWVVAFDHWHSERGPVEVARFGNLDDADNCAIELWRIVDGYYASPVVHVFEQEGYVRDGPSSNC